VGEANWAVLGARGDGSSYRAAAPGGRVGVSGAFAVVGLGGVGSWRWKSCDADVSLCRREPCLPSSSASTCEAELRRRFLPSSAPPNKPLNFPPDTGGRPTSIDRLFDGATESSGMAFGSDSEPRLCRVNMDGMLFWDKLYRRDVGCTSVVVTHHVGTMSANCRIGRGVMGV